MLDKLTIEDMTSEADQYNAQRDWEKAQRESDTDRAWRMMVYNDHLRSLREDVVNENRNLKGAGK